MAGAEAGGIDRKNNLRCVAWWYFQGGMLSSARREERCGYWNRRCYPGGFIEQEAGHGGGRPMWPWRPFICRGYVRAEAEKKN